MGGIRMKCVKCGKEIPINKEHWRNPETGEVFCVLCARNEPVVYDEVPTERWLRFEQICKECLDLAKSKDNLYGNLPIKELGIKGLFVRMWDKVNRLKSIVWEGKEDTPDEKLKDTLMDLINYSIYMILVKESKWS